MIDHAPNYDFDLLSTSTTRQNNIIHKTQDKESSANNMMNSVSLLFSYHNFGRKDMQHFSLEFEELTRGLATGLVPFPVTFFKPYYRKMLK